MLPALLLAAIVAQPIINLPPEEPEAPETVISPIDGLAVGMRQISDTELVRGLQSMRLRTPGTVIGSYGQFNLEYTGADGQPLAGNATVKRLVIFVSHHFSDNVRAYTEIEWENAVACSTCVGEVEIEQGFVDWDVLPWLSVRAGLILVPMGIINQWHEPPVFHGVNRPAVDTWIIPTTWRELGAGVTGRFADLWRYELYAMTSPDVLHLGPQGLRNASALGGNAPANGYMFAGRLEAEPLLGVVLGLSGVAGDMGDAVRFFNAAHVRSRLTTPLVGAALDGRWRRSGLEARVEAAGFWLPKAGALLESLREDGTLQFPSPDQAGPVPTFLYGVYGEVAYDVLRYSGQTQQQLLPFVRVEGYDTQAVVPAGFSRLLAQAGVEITAGLSYRPIWQLVFKADAQRFIATRTGARETRINGGMGYMF